jgi:hypothetical protein
MKKVKFLSIALLSMLSFQSFAATPDLNVNSLIQCTEGSTVANAVAELNEQVATQNTTYTSPRSGIVFQIGNHITSQPTITKLDNRNVSVCVTLNSKK